MSLFRPRIRFGLAAVAFALVLASCGTANDDPAAEVGPFSVDRSAFGESVSRDDAAELLTLWARNEIFYAEIVDRGYTINDAILEDARVAAEDAALTGGGSFDGDSLEGQNEIRGRALGPMLLEFFANEGLELPGQGPLCASHILVATEDEALAVLDRLDAGEDFAALAAEVSLDGAGGDGSLGCLDSSSLVPEFVDGVRATEIPGLSAPVQSQFGWHVIDVISFDPQPVVGEDAQIQALVATPEFAELRDAVLAREVTIDPDFGTWDQANTQVVP